MHGALQCLLIMENISLLWNINPDNCSNKDHLKKVIKQFIFISLGQGGILMPSLEHQTNLK